MEDLIEQHLQWCALAFSPETVKIRRFVLFKAHKEIEPHGLEARPDEIAAWLSNPEWEPATRSNYFKHLCGFFNQLIEAEELDWSPMKKLRRPKVPQRDPDPWTDEQMATLLDRARQPFRFAVVAAAFAGLRCMEVVQLSPKNTNEHRLRVKGKGGKTAEIDMHPYLWRELSQFTGPDEPFIVQAGGRQDAHWLSYSSARHFRRDLKIPVHLHQGRHWFVTSVYEAEGEAAAQQAARHASIATTQGYMALRNGQRRRGILALPVPNGFAA